MPPLAEDRASLTTTEDSATDNLRFTSGFKYYPKRRDDRLKNAELWMKGKAEVDGVYPHWRVHDKLYDLTPFIEKHPGGKFWIEATQGTDITESFESSHIGSGPEKILEKYFVKNPSTPRNSPFTFKQNGFYKTLKTKVTPILARAGTGPSWNMLFLQDFLFFGFVFFFFSAAWNDSVVSAVFGGVFACLAANAAHNFFHQKDNWRMYIFNMTVLSYRDWRISHAISHHVFPNTIYDFEISALEPGVELLPRQHKSFLCRHGAMVLILIYGALGFYIDIITRAILVCRGEIKLRTEHSIPPIQIGILVMVTGSVTRGLWLWFVLHTSCNFVFVLIGLTAAHHHPDIYHEGDVSYSDKDWGLHQIAATRDRMEINSSLLFVAVTYGNHTLHHLFPTVDHSKLPLLFPAFIETCQEFGVKFEYNTIWGLAKGSIAQIANVFPNTNVSRCFK